ncbi:phospholipase B, isoform CRA_a [Rattus norvegicus]|uniref:Phospholipase B, isoform CRA_a n=1 Tax=Rattus norvegicus TaxID=10116 RepID=A6HA30_RAT|nr:phospholipase B, isoform CRA_a [Rattus norvegicus]
MFPLVLQPLCRHGWNQRSKSWNQWARRQPPITSHTTGPNSSVPRLKTLSSTLSGTVRFF